MNIEQLAITNPMTHTIIVQPDEQDLCPLQTKRWFRPNPKRAHQFGNGRGFDGTYARKFTCKRCGLIYKREYGSDY